MISNAALIFDRSSLARHLTSFFVLAYCLSEVLIVKVPLVPVNLQQFSLILVSCVAFLALKLRRRPLAFLCRSVPASALFFYVVLAFLSTLFFHKGFVFGASLVVNFAFLVGVFLLAADSDFEKLIRSLHVTLRFLAWTQLALALLQLVVPAMLPPVLQPSGYGIIPYFRINGFFRDPTYFAFFMATCLFWNIFLAKRKKISVMVESVLYGFAILISGSYTVIVGLVVSFFLLFILATNSKRIKYIFIGIICIVFFVGYISQSKDLQMQLENKKIQVTKISDPRYNVRMFHLLIGMKMWADKPFIGHGYGSFPYVSTQYFPPWFYQSNYYINKLADNNGLGMISHVLMATVMGEMGSVGLLLVLIFLGATFAVFLGCYRKRRGGISLLFLMFWVLFVTRTLSYGFRLSDGFVLMHFGLGLAHIYILKCGSNYDLTKKRFNKTASFRQPLL